MGFIKRNEQKSEAFAQGMTMRVMAGAGTGSEMLHVTDVSAPPGSRTDYHLHPECEQSILVLQGDLQIRLSKRMFTAKSGDCVFVGKSQAHGTANVTSDDARFIAFYTHQNPSISVVDEPTAFSEEFPPTGLFRRELTKPYEFAPGVLRYDMVGDFCGATTSFFSELIFAPNTALGNHYHPAHEESMFCLEGNLKCVYGDKVGQPLAEGDMFNCEIGVRHGISNDSDEEGRLLAIHPVLNPPPRVDVP